MDVVANAWAFNFNAVIAGDLQVQTNYGDVCSRPTIDLLADRIQRRDQDLGNFNYKEKGTRSLKSPSREFNQQLRNSGKKSSSDLWSLFQAFRLSFPACSALAFCTVHRHQLFPPHPHSLVENGCSGIKLFSVSNYSDVLWKSRAG